MGALPIKDAWKSMWGQNTPSVKTPKAPEQADTWKAQLNALAYANTQKKIRQSQGRNSTFLTSNLSTDLLNGKTKLGQ